jgi:hypothetical protein
LVLLSSSADTSAFVFKRVVLLLTDLFQGEIMSLQPLLDKLEVLKIGIRLANAYCWAG